ncbi:MAG: T9SS type A sorting domain-containing protein [Chitinophagales bacterium]|nr:T9SS type A sorting domain-containing protein [Chitinophagales bacterium]
MKTIFTLLLSCITLLSAGSPDKIYDKLCEVNKCWKEQPDIAGLNYPVNDNRMEKEWISIHLQLVEQTLRTRSTEHLTTAQKNNRLAALEHLNQYWHSGAFPVNDQYAYRTPIFIDRYDNFCAVGYLVKATGHEDVSRLIASKTNLAYVREMHYPELQDWAYEYGFTIDELAWIQPGYPPETALQGVGRGTDGIVYELAVSANGEQLYVGGEFTEVDSVIVANNIAYVTLQNEIYTWHKMDSGVNGRVNAIVDFDNKVFVAGTFTMASGTVANNVAYWDGTKWNSAGCLAGVVNDLLVYKNELYAVGDFDVCASMSDINFAKWNGTAWLPLNGISGHINTAHVSGNYLVLGGKFSYNNDTVNIIRWEPVNGFIKYNAGIDNEVNDIHEYKGEMYVALSGDVDSASLVKKLDKSSGSWLALKHLPYSGVNGLPALYAFCDVGNDLLVAGNIDYPFSEGNCVQVMDTILLRGKSFGVDSAVYAMADFKNRFIAGGKFKSGSSGWLMPQMNSIAAQKGGVNVTAPERKAVGFAIHPNPSTSGTEVILENDMNANRVRLYDINGKLLCDKILDASKTMLLPQLAAGIYIVELVNEQGIHAVERLSVR